MTQSTETDWIEKIRKILAKAEAQGVTDEERDAYQAKAAELMTKYGIKAAHLAAADPTRAQDDPIVYVFAVPSGVGAKTYSKEWSLMGIHVATAFGAVGLYQTVAGGLYTCGVAGHKSDVQRIIMLWESLQRQAGFALAAYVRNIDTWPEFTGMEKYKARRSFIRGFADEVGDRLKRIHRDAVKEAESTHPGTDLVLRNRHEDVESWVRNTMKLGKARGSRSYDNGGYGAGAAAGARADVGQTTVGAKGRSALEGSK